MPVPEALSSNPCSQPIFQNFPLVDVAVPEIPMAEVGGHKGVLAVEVVAVAVGVRIVHQGTENIFFVHFVRLSV